MMKTKSLEYLSDLILRYSDLSVCKNEITQAIEILSTSYKQGGKLLLCGNGGSAADCEHIVGELMKGFKKRRPLSKELVELIDDKNLTNQLQYGLPAISLVSHAALSTAFSNDQMPEAVFAQQVLGYGKKEDVLLCISTSGNSINCVYAAKIAKALDMKVVSLTGNKKCQLEDLSDCVIQAPSHETYKVQEYHLPIYHTICLILEEEFFEE
ncbi:MAG: SIS domain-containing protein [Roseburia sp.]|nr:SIS domain-containing protein [Anaeroplasma bactoclasticum]MCM1196267.1 SIS domain-containing protein [Roseburia sp.]MCM1557374.1 SIS domain-containing protein [Anaeroplasma bactoclasticum]